MHMSPPSCDESIIFFNSSLTECDLEADDRASSMSYRTSRREQAKARPIHSLFFQHNGDTMIPCKYLEKYNDKRAILLSKICSIFPSGKYGIHN